MSRTERKYLLNCKNCAWHTYVEGPMMHADYERDCHEESLRTALSIGPHCPKGAVKICSVEQ